LKPKKGKLRKFILERQRKLEDLTPSAVHQAFNTLWKDREPISLQAVSQQLKRMGLGSVEREAFVIEKAKAEAGKDITDYEEVKAYISNAEMHHITDFVIKRTLKFIRLTWELMGKTDPHDWTEREVLEALKTKYPITKDAQDRRVFTSPHAVCKHLSAVSTIFKNVMSEGWSKGFSREKGELVDFFDFAEFTAYDGAAENFDGMSKIGWQAADRAQINLGCREGVNEKTGLMSLLWDDIDYVARRCSLHEKGGHGKAGRVWVNLPIGGQVFTWIQGWEALMEWHKERFGYYPSNSQHGTGRVFPVTYDDFRENFHLQRKRAGGRIASEKETLTPHIARKTHAQWLKRLRVPMEIACGKFPDGTFGVGWDNVNIYKDFYTRIEPDEYSEAMDKATARMKVLGLA